LLSEICENSNELKFKLKALQIKIMALGELSDELKSSTFNHQSSSEVEVKKPKPKELLKRRRSTEDSSTKPPNLKQIRISLQEASKVKRKSLDTSNITKLFKSLQIN
jgi:hypothetical protein